MTEAALKPRLSRAHVLELLRQMIRIREFEARCYQLYTEEKIRGFMHLYDGEEAVAVGVIPVLTADDRTYELPVGYSERLHKRLEQALRKKDDSPEKPA